MQKKLIKIWFDDFWKGFVLEDYFFYKFLSKRYDLVLDSKNPDYLFYSCFSQNHFGYKNSIKIYYTGENDVPNFNNADYAIGFSLLNFKDRYLRFPLYLFQNEAWEKLTELENKIISDDLLDRKFCNFVYSNNINADPLREYFFKELSKYKKIDSGGRYLNNIGGPVVDKFQFISQYKFTIAFENSFSDGYTTEKLIEPMFEKSLPLYWGNPSVGIDFNINSFLYLNDSNGVKKLIEHIIYLDENPKEYLRVLSQPNFNEINIRKIWENKLTLFFDNIFNQTLSEARRIPQYGFNKQRMKEERISASLRKNIILRKYYSFISLFNN